MKKNKIFPLISITTSDIKKIIGLYSQVISKNPTIPILGYIKFSFDLTNSIIIYEGTNLAINIVTSTPFKYKIKEQLDYNLLEVCIPFIELNKILSICKSDEIKMKFDDKIVSINFSNLTYKLPYLLETKEFPVTPATNKDTEKVILIDDEKLDFFENLKNIANLTLTENMMDVSQSCVSISGENGFVNCSIYIAFLMSFFKFENTNEFSPILIDKNAALISAKTLKGTKVKFIIGENIAIFRNKDITITITLQKGSSRNIIAQYDKLKSSVNCSLKFDKEEFLEIMKSLSIVDNKVYMINKDDKIHLISASDTEQKADKIIDLNGVLSRELIFNSKWISDLISVLKSKEIEFKYCRESNQHHLVVESDDENDKYKGNILMLMDRQ